MRIVTTLPSATELVCALECDPVGVSHECDYPPGVAELPSVTASRVDADASSGEIDEQVLEAAGDGGVYDVDVRTLERLDPDLVVTQGICDVCAVDEVVVERALERADADPVVLTTDPHTVDDVLGDVARVGRAVDREERAAALIADLESRIDAVRDRVATARSRHGGDPPRVAVLDWTDPVMVAGHWVPELVAAAGGEYGLADPGDASRPREWTEIRDYDPEVLIVAPCGFDLEQTAENLADLTDREGWADLTAVRENRVWTMDGNHYLNRPGPRLVDALEYLEPIVAPDAVRGSVGAFDDQAAGGPPADVAVPLSGLEGR